MRNHPLHEVAKIAAGFVAADFVSLLWLSQQPHALPLRTMGLIFTSDMIMPGLIFDLALFLILVHYGWNIGRLPRPRERTYLLLAGIIFTVVAAVHLFRLFFGTTVDIAGWNVPLWLSWFGVALTAYLAYMSFYLATHAKR